MPFELNMRADFDGIARTLNDAQRKQLPFAVATTLTALANIVRDDERDNMFRTFVSPTPFTLNSIGVIPARKTRQVATVFVKDIAAAYLMPYEFGGVHKLAGRALLNPKDIPLNQYGQLPRGTLAKLKNDPNVFIGSITFRKSGDTVSGVWQRPPLAQQKATRGRKKGVPAPAQVGLKLLIRFGEALPVREHLDFRKRANAIVRRHFQTEFRKALAYAMSTART